MNDWMNCWLIMAVMRAILYQFHCKIIQRKYCALPTASCSFFFFIYIVRMHKNTTNVRFIKSSNKRIKQVATYRRCHKLRKSILKIDGNRCVDINCKICCYLDSKPVQCERWHVVNLSTSIFAHSRTNLLSLSLSYLAFSVDFSLLPPLNCK